MKACELGRLSVARHAFECGLRINSRHMLLLERLMEVLLKLGDWEAAAQLARRLLQSDPGHPRAAAIASESAADPTRSGAALHLKCCIRVQGAILASGRSV